MAITSKTQSCSGLKTLCLLAGWTEQGEVQLDGPGEEGQDESAAGGQAAD